MLTLNKKVLKKIIFLMISFIILCGGCVKAVVKPTNDFYVNDYAGLLNEETKSYIMNANQSLKSKTRCSNCSSYCSFFRRTVFRGICYSSF
ncbi:MAG: hypothetical protein HFJ20_06875 [Clostridia bacterium]|nr:hypothetical protein [Clostridia bacterium]